LRKVRKGRTYQGENIPGGIFSRWEKSLEGKEDWVRGDSGKSKVGATVRSRDEEWKGHGILKDRRKKDKKPPKEKFKRGTKKEVLRQKKSPGKPTKGLKGLDDRKKLKHHKKKRAIGIMRRGKTLGKLEGGENRDHKKRRHRTKKKKTPGGKILSKTGKVLGETLTQKKES